MKKKQIIIAIYTLAVVCLSSCEQEDFHINRSEDSAELSSLLKQIDKMSNQKVALYNQKKAAYNVKWKLITDCNVVQPPVILICNDGKPKFVY